MLETQGTGMKQKNEKLRNLTENSQGVHRHTHTSTPADRAGEKRNKTIKPKH